jgi:chemotaxis protein methyltransferase CheR
VVLSGDHFERTLRLASRLAGIGLSARHRELLDHRFQRLGLRDSASLEALLDAAEAGEDAATRKLVHVLTTRYTAFFRHPQHFAAAAERAAQACAHQGKARLWCTAVATGEEAYSLAIAVLESLPSSLAPVRILASDIDAEALSVAALGRYREAAMHPVDDRRRERYFRLESGGVWSPVDAVRQLIEFRRLNLAHPDGDLEGAFEVVICRNVLMYLEPGRREAVLRRLASLMAPEGLLILDPTEYIGKAGSLFDPLGDGLYTASRRRGAEAAINGLAGAAASSGSH